MNPHDPVDDDGELDRLLARAQWPPVDTKQVARLGDHWRALNQRQRMRRRIATLALAAGIVLAVGLALRYRHQEPAGSDRPLPALASRAPAEAMPVAKDTPPSEDTPAATPVAAMSVPAPAPVPAAVEPREPTLHERMALLAASAARRQPDGAGRRKGSTAPLARRFDQKAARQFLDGVIAALAADPEADVDARLATIAGSTRRFEPWLLELTQHGDSPQRWAATAILARVGTGASLPALSAALNDPTTHAAAVAGLCRLAPPADLKILAVLEPRAELRLKLIEALLDRRTAELIELFLELVGNESLQSDALTASSSLADPPVDLLVSFLESPRQPVRLAAAEALGSLPSTDIAARLEETALEGIGRQEALLALLLSPDEQSAQFLAAARQDLYLVASVRAAEQQLRSLTLAKR